MAEIEPKTREEKLWSGEDIKPLTREEMYIKHIFDNTQTIPDHPITRKEMLMEKAGEGGGGDITIKQLIATENKTYSEEDTAYSPVIVNVPDVPPVLDELTVTENGTYTPPSGTDGYDEVTVSVPLPPNAYLLKEIEDVAIASFNYGTDLPMPKLEVAIEPQQDLHGYDAPWVGGARKNKAQPVITTNTTLGGIAFNPIKDNDGNVLGLSVGNGTVNADINQHIAEFYCSESGTYKIIGAKLNGSLSINKRILLWDNTSQTTTVTIIDNNEVSVSLTAEHEYSLAINIRSSVTVDASELRFMICKDSESSTFAPYSNICPISGWSEANVTVADDVEPPTVSNVYTIDLDGTRYGGKVDLVSGVMVLTHGFADLGTVNWDKYTSSTKTYFRTSAQLPDAKKSDNPSTTHNLMCSNYKEDTWSHVIDGSDYDGNICIGWNNNAYIGIYDSRYVDTSVSDFKTAMSGVQLVYELATPLTIQLTPTVVKSLRGVNNVWADSGDVLDLSYLAKEE